MLSSEEIIQGVLLGVVLVLLYTIFKRENYVSKREKAEAIHGWWDKNSSPSYEKYKSDVKGSDVVEYTAVKKLKKSGEVSVDSVEKIIS